MPKSTKENAKSKNVEKANNKSTSKVSSSRATSSKKTASSKTTKKASSTKSAKKVAAAKSKVRTTKAKTPVVSKTSNKPVTKKTTSRTTTTKKTQTKKTNKKPIKTDLEYYDLPYRYNQTIVKMLAQSPHTLFVYWDISDTDRENMIKTYGENFFNKTEPVLIITNKTKNYTFEIRINDFANCWYFGVEDEKCEYLVELGRRPIDSSISIPNNYLYISSSNEIESPNGHILFEKEQNTLYFRNVKENYTYSKDVANLHLINHLKRIYKIYDIYKIIYKNEEFFDVNNPTSMFK